MSWDVNMIINNNGLVFVDDFNAVGNGIADDSQAFADAFNYAKGKKIKVLTKGKKYRLRNSQPIDIFNDVNFNGAELLIDDTQGHNQHLFRILHDNPIYQLDDTTLKTIKSKFLKSTSRIPELSGLGNAILYIYDNTKKMYIREGGNEDNGDEKFDQVTIDNEGYFTSQLTWDFDNITLINVQKIDDCFIEVKNGSFISSNDVPLTTASYINKGIFINRSNVVISNISHKVQFEQNGLASRNGFIFYQSCANIILDKINLQPLKKQSQGTYEIGGSKVVNIKMYNINAQSFDTSDRWGVMGARYLKNLTIKDTQLSRIDSHSGLHNITIDNCVIGSSGITVVGHGDLILKNSKFFSNNVIDLRSDYGSSWNGNIYINNIYHKPFSNNGTSLIKGSLKNDWDYGYATTFGTGIISVENYVVDLINGDFAPVLFKISATLGYDGIEKTKYKLAREFKVNNAIVIHKRTDNEGLKAFNLGDISKLYGHSPTFIFPDGNFIPNVTVSFENVDFGGTFAATDTFSNFFSNLSYKGFDATDDYGTVLDRLFFKFSVTNVKKLYANLKGLYAYLYIDKSTVRNLLCNKNGSRAFIYVSDSTIQPLVSTFSEVAFYAKKENLFFSNCTFTKAYYKNNLPVNTVGLNLQYEFLKFGTVGSTIRIEANLSSCVFDPSVDFKNIRGDIGDTAFIFGNNHHSQKFPMLRGTTAQRPPSIDIKPSFVYIDTTLNKPITFDGTNWIDETGRLV